ncbi:hypothetical protein ZWY2020_000667 [Hordeum vulgare]|nr:hypothetical protein ZWY2020_000667 [Hordeum vulgare]
MDTATRPEASPAQRPAPLLILMDVLALRHAVHHRHRLPLEAPQGSRHCRRRCAGFDRRGAHCTHKICSINQHRTLPRTTHYVLLLCSFKEQLQQHVRVHAMEAVMACWELEQTLQSLTRRNILYCIRLAIYCRDDCVFLEGLSGAKNLELIADYVMLELQLSFNSSSRPGKERLWLKLPVDRSKFVPVALKVLVVQEKYRDWVLDGVWKLPTGFIQESEEICTGAIREVQEETGVDTSAQSRKF